jgi:hypothetical protein
LPGAPLANIISALCCPGACFCLIPMSCDQSFRPENLLDKSAFTSCFGGCINSQSSKYSIPEHLIPLSKKITSNYKRDRFKIGPNNNFILAKEFFLETCRIISKALCMYETLPN